MPEAPIRVLLIEDNPADARLVAVALAESSGARFQMKTAARLSAGLDYLRHDQFDVVLLDLSLPDCPREETIARVSAAAARLPIVVMTGLDDERLSREIVKQGAQDYLVKGRFDGQWLTRALFYAIERKRAHEEIARARDAALEAVGLKSAFLANMSHEIRTPMNAIIGMTRMLLDTRLNPDQREFAEVVWSSAHSLLGIINDVLDFSKVSAGKLRLEEIDFSPTETLEGAIELFAEQVQRSRIELASFVDAAVPARLRGDPVRLRQVLINLIGNAIKFTAQGDVTVTVECASASPTDATLRFSIRDTGPGIAFDAQPHLFQAFYQADSSTTRRHGGTGLGLAISAQIVARMDGEIGVESAPGQGANFWFTARFKLAPNQADAAAHEELHGRRVLLAAPDTTAARLLTRQIESWGMNCERATSAAQTLAAAAMVRSGDRWDAILLDCHLEGMEGLALARRLSELEAVDPARLIGLCQIGKRPEGAALDAAGIRTMIAKPVRQSQLRCCLFDLVAAARSTARDSATPQASGAMRTHTPFCEIARAMPAQERARARILVAEDHPVNRSVVLKMLERLGYRASAVTNGAEVLAEIERADYDVILMDCQMPELDGYEASRAIRRDARRDAVAIIGLTAHALAGDRQKCLAAGMDDYLSKPFLPEDLAAILARWLMERKRRRDPEAESTVGHASPRNHAILPPDEAPAAAPMAVDPEALTNLEAADEDGGDFVRRLIGVFLSDLDARIAAMRTGVAEDDPAAVAQAAHAIKGSCGHFGATPLAALCRELEATARSNSDAQARGLVAAVERESSRVRAALESWNSRSARPTA